jgi:hypothetical protein
VLLLHVAEKEVPLVQAAPSVSLVPEAKFTAAHCCQKGQPYSTSREKVTASTYLVQSAIAGEIGDLKDTGLAGEALGCAQVVQAEYTRTLGLHH